MNFTNINDPAGVAALLDQLKSSSAWKELELASATLAAEAETPIASSSSGLPHVSSPNTVDEPSGPAEPYGEHNVSSSAVLGSSVASLLSQLKPFSAGYNDPLPNTFAYGYGEIQDPSAAEALPGLPSLGPIPPTAQLDPREDPSNFTFRQSLPVISDLSDNPAFVMSVQKMKADQDDLERRLWADREAIYSKYHDKLKVAQTKARMVGGNVSQHEINMITDAFKKEMQKFDHDRVLPAWDGLVSRQQLELSQLEVPTMLVTADDDHRERQQQVIGLLETLLGPKTA